MQFVCAVLVRMSVAALALALAQLRSHVSHAHAMYTWAFGFMLFHLDLR